MAYCIGYKHPKRGYLFLQRDLKTFSSFPDFWSDEASAKNVIASYKKSILNRDVGALLRVIDEYHLNNLENHPDVDLPEENVTVKSKTRADAVVFDGRNMEGFKQSFENNQAFFSTLRQAVAFIEMIDDEIEKCQKEIFYEELKILDITHYIELKEFDQEEGAELALMIRKCRKRRRVAKDRESLLKLFKKILNTNRDEDAAILFDALKKKAESLDKRVYVPRVLKDLFEHGVDLDEKKAEASESVLDRDDDHCEIEDDVWDEAEKKNWLAKFNSTESLKAFNQKLSKMNLPVNPISQ